jgi:hypothetical protein
MSESPSPRGPFARAFTLIQFYLFVRLVVVASGCVDQPGHPYVDPVRLRIVPESSVISPAGGSLFVLIELAQRESSAGGDVTIRLHAENGEILMLPGPVSCEEGAGDGAVEANDAAGELVGLAIPPAAQRSNSTRGVREAALVVRVPPGDDDVLLTASAYSADSNFDCETLQGELQAISFTRIARRRPISKPDATDSPGRDAGPEEDALGVPDDKDAALDGDGD